MKKYLALLLAALMLVAAFAGCGDKKEPAADDTATPAASDPSTPDDTPQVVVEKYGTYRDYFTAFPPTLNSYAQTGVPIAETNSWLQAMIYNDRATADGNDWEWWCEMAADWPQMMDAEGKVWRVTLKEGLKWENGDTFDADDVIYSIKMKCDPDLLNTAAAGCGALSYFHCLNLGEYHDGEATWDQVGIRKIDDLTVEFECEYPVPQINVQKFSGSTRFVYRPLYEAGLSPDGSVADYGTEKDKYMSCGPFKVEEWIPDAKFVLTRNDNYVRPDLVHYEKVEFSYVPNAETALQLFLNGELDYCNIDYNDWEQFEDDPRVYEYFDDSLMYMFVNLGNPSQNNILGDINYRKALYYGSDRTELADTMGVYTASGYVRKAVIGNLLTGQAFVDMPRDYIPDAATLFQPDKALEYLNKALEAKGLTSSTVEFLQAETATFNKAVHQMLMKQYESVFKGKLTGHINQVPSTIQLRRWNPDNPTSYEISIGSLLPSATDPRASFYFFTSEYNPPRVKWNNLEFDALYAESQKLDLYNEQDAEKIVELCQKMEKIMLDDLVIIPLYERQNKVLYNEKLKLTVNHHVVGFGFGDKWGRFDH